MTPAIQIDNCRFCDTKLENFLDLGLCALANDYENNHGKYPLNVKKCPNCGTHQLAHNVDPEILFGNNYNYSTPDALDSHFQEAAKTIIRKVGLDINSRCGDIGGNNGKFCRFLMNEGVFNVVNIEPSKNVAEESRNIGIRTVTAFFSKDFAEDFVEYNGKLDFAYSANCFAHPSTVPDMMTGVEILLNDGGVFVQENANLRNTLLNNDLTQHYFEHSLYISITSLRNTWTAKGFTLYDVEFIDTQCGSFRAYLRKGNYEVNQSVIDALKEEEEFFKSEGYLGYENRLKQLKYRIKDFVAADPIALVGISAKAALLVEYFGLKDNLVEAYDDSALKIGKFVPGTDIKIQPMSELANTEIKKIVVPAFNFANLLLKRFPNLGAEWCIPIPEFRILKN